MIRFVSLVRLGGELVNLNHTYKNIHEMSADVYNHVAPNHIVFFFMTEIMGLSSDYAKTVHTNQGQTSEDGCKLD